MPVAHSRLNAVAPGTIRTERVLALTDEPSFVTGVVLPVDGGYLAR